MPTLRHRFATAALYHERGEEPIVGFLSRRWSFWLALFSCIAFLVGNMVGQHGWQAFWKSVWGMDQEIVFDGTVFPVAGLQLDPYVPDMSCSDEIDELDIDYPVEWLGNYNFGGQGCGSHPGIDIKLPMETEIVAVANGSIESVDLRDIGFGNTIVLKIPNAPHESDPHTLTTYYAGYSHLSKIFVQPGDIVKKGQRIALSGETGIATTPHLQFQIDKDTAEFHPYWPFTMDDVRRSGLYSLFDGVNAGVGMENARKYTINPLVYVQRYATASTKDLVEAQQKLEPAVAEEVAVVVEEPPKSWIETVKERLQQRISERESKRLAARERMQEIIRRSQEETHAAADVPDEVAVVTEVIPEPEPVTVVEEVAIVPAQEVVTPEPVPIVEEHAQAFVTPHGTVIGVTILHDGELDDDGEQMVLYARDAAGNFVHDVQFEGSFHIASTFGDAVFQPAELMATHFDDRGRAFVTVSGKDKTIIPVLSGAFEGEGEPMKVVRR